MQKNRLKIINNSVTVVLSEDTVCLNYVDSLLDWAFCIGSF